MGKEEVTVLLALARKTVENQMVLAVLDEIRSVLSYEFPSQDAMDEYLKSHPKADKDKHWVKEQGKKPAEKEPAKETPDEKKPSDGGKFSIPQHPKWKMQTEGDLSNVENWKAQIILGNSMNSGKKKGDMDDVGYVAINTKTSEIVPIARGDEHQSGYELLYHLSRKGMVKGEPDDYITLFHGNNYPQYYPDTDKYVKAVQKWLDYGGENAPIAGDKYTTDMKEFVELKGKLPKQSDEPSNPAKEVLGLMGDTSKQAKAGDSKALSSAGELVKKMARFYTVAYVESDVFKKSSDAVQSAIKNKDVEALKEPLRAIASDVLSGLEGDDGFQQEHTKSFYGFGDTAKKQLKELVGDKEEKPEKEKTKEQRGLKPHAKDSVSKFEQAAKGLKKISEGVSSEKDEEAFVDSAASLVKHLEGTDLGKGPMKEMLQSANRAVAGYDAKKLGEILFSFKGVKNFMHMYLRELKERGHKDDDYFGNVDDALTDFEKLGQI